MKIYTKFGKQPTIREFIQKLYSIRTDSRADCVETFVDEECRESQCTELKLRSFDDIFDCVNTYYDNVSPKELFYILLTLDIKSSTNKPLSLHMSNCSTIKRIRMLYYYNDISCINNTSCIKHESRWSWIDLFKMLDIDISQLKYTERIAIIKEYIDKNKENETLQNS
ncbi:MAG: hypothetical protein ACEQSQ_06150 [Candidatus Paceibacteria bacterium]